jgi:2-polyprenyl-3-methyl-5-hydroxy-6-metoxy-1,4-benzoquinol methylase
MARCPICSGMTSQFDATNVDRAMLICRSCRHIFWQDMPSQSDLQDYYQSYTRSFHQDDIQQSNIDVYRRHILELKALCVTDRPAILDYGCSVPVLLNEARSLGFDTLGVDYSPEASAWGDERGVRVIQPTDLEAEDEQYDVIRFSHVMEHLIDPVAALRKCLSLLKPDGFVYITQPSFPVFRLDARVPMEDADWPSHLHFFSPLSLAQLLLKCGLDPFRMYSHDRLTDRWRVYGGEIDDSGTLTASLARLGDKHFGILANVPNFVGANSTVYASLAI